MLGLMLRDGGPRPHKRIRASPGFDWVRLGSEIEHNRTLTQTFWFDCVRFPNPQVF